MKSKFTHTGTVIPISSAALGEAYTTKLRETKNWYVSEFNTKYGKRGGYPIGVSWPHWMLDLNTVKPVTPQ